MPEPPKVRWTDGDHIAAMLDGIDTIPCNRCGADCAVPEYVLGVEQTKDGLRPVGLCQACVDETTNQSIEEVSQKIANLFLR